jgi:serine/threonine protein kinase
LLPSLLSRLRLQFLVMQYLEGETLADRLKKEALPLDQALQYAIQIADALDKAHRASRAGKSLRPAGDR